MNNSIMLLLLVLTTMMAKVMAMLPRGKLPEPDEPNAVQSSTQLIIKNLEKIDSGAETELKQQAYPTALAQFTWHLHAEYFDGHVYLTLEVTPQTAIQGEILLHCRTIVMSLLHKKDWLKQMDGSISNVRNRMSIAFADIVYYNFFKQTCLLQELLNTRRGFLRPDGSIKVKAVFTITYSTQQQLDIPNPNQLIVPISSSQQMMPNLVKREDLDFSTVLIVKNVNEQNIRGEHLKEQAYPTEIGYFSWHLHAIYNGGNIAFTLFAKPSPDMNPKYVLIAKYRLTIVSLHHNMDLVMPDGTAHYSQKRGDPVNHSNLIGTIGIKVLLNEKQGFLHPDGSFEVKVEFSIVD